MKINYKEKKGFICDMDGVIYHGNKILPGAKEFIHWLQDNNKNHLFLTNNSGMTPKELKQKLKRLGVDVRENHIKRLQEEKCTFKNGICLLEMLSNIERVSGQCSNVSGYIIDLSKHNMNSHENGEEYIMKNPIYKNALESYKEQYSLH